MEKKKKRGTIFSGLGLVLYREPIAETEQDDGKIRWKTNTADRRKPSYRNGADGWWNKKYTDQDRIKFVAEHGGTEIVFPFQVEEGTARRGRSRDTWKDKVPKISKASPSRNKTEATSFQDS